MTDVDVRVAEIAALWKSTGLIENGDMSWLLSEVRRLRSVVEDAERVIAESRSLLESWPETKVYKVRDLLDAYQAGADHE